MTVKVVQTTQVACETLADICDLALGYPRYGTPGGRSPRAATPSSWNSWGTAPHAWTHTAAPIWFSSTSDCWYELSDATAAIVAASGLLSAGQKATVNAVLAGRASVADPSQVHVRTARYRNRRRLRVLCDGDSWVTGSTATPAFHSWRTQLQILAQADPNCPGLEFVGPVNSGDSVSPALNAHNGVNGTGLASHNGAALTTNLTTYYPDVLILFCGTNDAGAPIDVNLYKTYFTDAFAARPAMRLIWTTQPDLFSQPNLATFIAAIPAATAALISASPTMQIVSHNFTGAISVGDTSASHPTAAGYDLLAASLWPTFKAALGF